MDLNALDYLPKIALEDEKRYEGYTSSGIGAIGRWDHEYNRFIVKLHDWEEAREISMTHPEDENEYYPVFYPMGEA
jgi:hypothetical protein